MIGALFKQRLSAVVAMCALAAVGAGCGENEDSSDARGSGGNASAKSAVTDEQEVRATFVRLHNAVYDGDGKTFCAGVTDRVIAATVQPGQSKDETSCEAGVRSLVPKPLSRTVRAQYRPTIVSIDVTGDKAIVRARGSDGGIDIMPFLRRDGDWIMDRAKLVDQR